jgi:hypothetical protein
MRHTEGVDVYLHSFLVSEWREVVNFRSDQVRPSQKENIDVY